MSLPCDEAPPNLQPEILCFKFQCQFGNAKTIELLHFMFNCAGNMWCTGSPTRSSGLWTLPSHIRWRSVKRKQGIKKEQMKERINQPKNK